ncbi:MAG: response regulator transcription factor [Nocardioides sp.]|nr:response regulator transcription factor [Nocardioides sp.]MDP3891795.1 response regulator transcription factor [Nocardioides sp.]
MKVMLVEDDTRLADAVASALRTLGHDVTRYATGKAALAAPETDIVLLDVGLPDINGIELCRRLRDRTDAAIIMLTARGLPRDRVTGLRSGADDYVVKPFVMDELVARMEAVTRRMPLAHTDAEVTTVGDLGIDLAGRQVTRAGVPVQLSRKEFDLLAVLLRELGHAVPKERLMLEVWGTSWSGNQRTLEVHMATLRRKLDAGDLIRTVRGVGYCLQSPPPEQ